MYHVKGEAAALAAAEAFTYGNPALISTDGAGATAFGKMLEFLQTIPPGELPPVADFGFVDDASDTAGELLNLLTRMNLLYQDRESSRPAFQSECSFRKQAISAGRSD